MQKSMSLKHDGTDLDGRRGAHNRRSRHRPCNHQPFDYHLSGSFAIKSGVFGIKSGVFGEPGTARLPKEQRASGESTKSETESRPGSEAGSNLRLIDLCITQL